jgi:hypothetical protein
VQVRLKLPLTSISLRGADYPVVGGIVHIPDDYLPDLLAADPKAEPVTNFVGNPPPPPPATDGRNKA